MVIPLEHTAPAARKGWEGQCKAPADAEGSGRGRAVTKNQWTHTAEGADGAPAATATRAKLLKSLVGTWLKAAGASPELRAADSLELRSQLFHSCASGSVRRMRSQRDRSFRCRKDGPRAEWSREARVEYGCWLSTNACEVEDKPDDDSGRES